MSQKTNENYAPSGVEPEEIPEPTYIDMVEPEPDPEQVESAVSQLHGEVCAGQFYFRTAQSYKILTHEETLYLARKVSKGDKSAREKIILHNLRLVLFFAFRFKNRGMDLDDLIQVGNIGLMKAVERFNYKLGYKFSTYAAWWIKQYIRRALANQTGPVRLPVWRQNLRSIINRAAEELGNELGRKPTVDEISERSNLSRLTVCEILAGAGYEAFSLDARMESMEGNETTYSDIFPDQNGIGSDVKVCAKEELDRLGSQVTSMLSALNSSQSIKDRDRKIFRRFYGLNGSVDIYSTLDLVAGEFNLTRERIRQILRKIWGNLHANYPQLELDHRRLISLYTRVATLENATEREISVGKITEATTVVEKRENATPSHNNSKRIGRQLKHIRATPAFVHWRPNPSNLDQGRAAIQLVGAAYEIEVPLHMNRSGSAQVRWARNLAMYIMRNDLDMPYSAINAILGQSYPQKAESACDRVRLTLANDSLVRVDVEKIRSHFRTVKGLPEPQVAGI